MSTGDRHAPEDVSMLDLLRVELENHSAVLEQGIVKVEADASPAALEGLMRAAHSIKGAARIVGLDPAVALAHAMEDVFSAAQRGQMRLTAPSVDCLLRATDVFAGLASAEAAVIPARLAEQADAIQALARTVRDLLGSPPSAPPSQPALRADAARTESPKPAAAEEPMSAADRGFVRINASNLSRLMGLAGELLVQTRSMESLTRLLTQVKAHQRQLGAVLSRSADRARSSSSPWSADGGNDAEQLIDRLQHATLSVFDAFDQISRRLERIASLLYDQVLAARMRPLSEGIQGFPRMVRDLAGRLGKQVRLDVQGASTPVDRDILERIEAPLIHAVRNAVDHGIEPPEERVANGKPPCGLITLHAEHRAGMLHITVSDDGRGVDMAALRRRIAERGHVTPETAERLSTRELLDFLFLPGFTTAKSVTEVSGRGVGLDVVLSETRSVGGAVDLTTRPGSGTTIRLQLPLALSVIRALIVEVGGEPFALPLSRIDRLCEITPESLHDLEDRPFVSVDGENVGLVSASEVLQMPADRSSAGRGRGALVISDRLNRYGLVVDRFLKATDLVVIPLDARLGQIPNVSAGAVMEDGTPLLILDVADLVRSIHHLLAHGRPSRIGEATGGGPTLRAQRVLVVDDSLTVREVERKLLANRGYDVAVAVDGADAWNTLRDHPFDIVVTDVDMPRMNGIDLLRRIRASPRLGRLPVIIVSYKERDEDRLQGLEAGANHYLTKGRFHDEGLLDAVRDLIGDPMVQATG